MTAPVRALLTTAATLLREAGVASPDHDAAELLAFVLGTTRGRLPLVEEVPPSAVEQYDALLARRAAREPLQHLTGVAHFRFVELAVGPGVFVPRPETELLAGWAVEQAAALEHPVVVDLCTGSGAIAIAVAREVPHAEVHAVELDEQALAWAARNVSALTPRVDLRAGDAGTAFPDLDGLVDVVVSNPPYVPPGAVPVDPEVRDHDPAVALYGLGPDGLQVPRAVVAAAARLLRPAGLLVVEHADVQQDALCLVLTTAGQWDDVAGHRDLTERPRYLTARRRPG